MHGPNKVAPKVIKFCTLMSGDSLSSETVELDDPSFSVAKWTQTMAAKLGLDQKSCEAVDAQTSCTIDPCRQAIDALQNRFVLASPIPLVQIGSRTLTVMSQAQFQERQLAKEPRTNWRDPLNTISFEQNALLQYHQHGDISYCEITSEAERSRLKGEHSLGLTKFLRKASAAVTNKETESPKEQKPPVKGPQSVGVRRRSGQGVASGVYCGEEQMADAHQKEPAKKRLSIFKNKGEGEKGTTPEKSPGPARRSPQLYAKESNGDTPRTPAIYATKIINDEEPDANSFIWQPAAYV
ncbi:unnamed protein product, partial [Mesorhabditis spiculigera]